MTFVTVNPDDSIDNITDTDETGRGIKIMLDPDFDDLAEVKNNLFGHSVFDFIDGEIVLNADRFETQLLDRDKQAYIDQILTADIEAAARKAIEVEIATIESASDRAVFDSLKRT